MANQNAGTAARLIAGPRLSNKDINMPKTQVLVTAVMLRRSGDYAIVEMEMAGRWFEVIREHLEGNFSHIAEGVVFTRKPSQLDERGDATPHN